MKEPKKTLFAILLGLVFVVIIYLLIVIARSLWSSNGKPSGFAQWLYEHNLNWLYAALQIMIGLGVLGIINGFLLWSTRFIEDLVGANESPFSVFSVKYINQKHHKICVIYTWILASLTIIIFSVIGWLCYINKNYDDNGIATNFGTGVAQLYSFADLMSTWSTFLAFVFIVLALYESIKIEKPKKFK